MAATQQLLSSYGTAWTPADIADLDVFLWMVQANCTPSSIGGPVTTVAPLFGTTIQGQSIENLPAVGVASLSYAPGYVGPASITVNGTNIGITYGTSSGGYDVQNGYIEDAITYYYSDTQVATNLAAFLSASALASVATFIVSGATVIVTTSTVFGPSATITIDGVTTHGPSIQPILRSDGLEFDTTNDVLNFSSPVALGSGDFTIYCVGYVPTDQLIMLGCSSTPAMFAEYGGLQVFNDAGTSSSAAATSGLILCRLTNNSGTVSVQAPGGVDDILEVTGSFTFETIGASPYQFVFNGYTANRTVLTIIIQRYIALNSDEDVLIRNWITTNTGASL